MPGKFVVLADLDGAAGVRNPHECFPNYPEFEQYGVPHMAADANAAARGLFKGGASEVVIVDGHLIGQNLISARVEAPAHLSAKTLLEELQRGGVCGLFLTGIHAKTGTPNSFSSHTIAPFLAARVNGDIVGDSLLVAYLAGALDVPLVGVSGDWVACEEIQWALPWILNSPTKTGFDRASVRHHNPDTARASLEEIAARAAAPGAGRVVKPSPEFRVELSLARAEDAQLVARALDGAGPPNRRVFAYAGQDFVEATEFLGKAVGAIYPAWVDGLGRRARPETPGGYTAGGMLDTALIERFMGPTAPYWSD
jgi:D-amino peptidase